MKKISKYILGLIITFLVLIICVGGYFLLNKINESNKKVTDLENEINILKENNKKVENDIVINEEKENDVVKENIDDKEEISKMKELTKNYVIDAEYTKNKEEKTIKFEYNSENNESYTTSEALTVPYIRFNSEDANTTNNEIKKIYEEYYNKFGTNAGSEYLYYVPEMFYISYKNDNILSIVFVYCIGITGSTYSEYNIKTYNFNLDTLKYASFDEISKVGGYSKESIIKTIEKINNSTELSGCKLELKENEVFLALDGTMYAVCTGGSNSGGERVPYINMIVNLETEKEEFIEYSLYKDN